MEIPKSHPRYESLMQRRKVEEGVGEGYTALAGLIAHGRGECFDYLIGEKTVRAAESAEKTAAALLLSAKNPVISVNGNVAALCPEKVVALAEEVNAKIEVNLFYRTKEREDKIARLLEKAGGKNIMKSGKGKIKGLESKRGEVNEEGILKADVVLVPLEDGDRTEALVNAGKKVITIDLNPLSRTSRTATVPIVDNVSRALPAVTFFAKELKGSHRLDEIVEEFRKEDNLKSVLDEIIKRLEKLCFE